MRQTLEACPGCSNYLDISWDMWGPFYTCEECGFTAEDDDDLMPKVAEERLVSMA